MKLSDAREIHSICEKIRQVEEEMIAIDKHARAITESVHEFSVQLHGVDETERKRKEIEGKEKSEYSSYLSLSIFGSLKKDEINANIVAVTMDASDTLSVLSMMMQRKEKERKELVSQIKAIENEN